MDSREKGRTVGSAALADMLQVEIGRGSFPIGDVIPSEAELRARFNVGRHTVREAVNRLVQAGLVEKRQGAPTRVVAVQPKANYVHSVRTLGEIIQFTRETQLEITDRSIVPVQGADAEFLGAAPNTRWLRLHGVRRAVGDEEVIGYTTIFVHSRFAPVIANVRFPSGPLYALFEQATGEIVHEAVQAISAGKIPSDAARALKLSTGETAIKVTRHYFDMSGGIMLASINWHSPSTFSYVIKLRRDQIE